MLKQVWMNLLGNAIKYTSKKEAPQIEVGAIADGSFHIYYIKDNGAGFDMKYAGKLFGVFQRLHRQDEFEGTGLGLALAKRIISKHGGEIRVEALPEMGATFYFSIPKTNNE
jgi:light-regulated signal transduction histidine kinase (bacteriophytochrome)